MRLYDLKHNGFIFGQKRGKNEAIKALNRHLEFEGISKERQAWIWPNEYKDIRVEIKDQLNEFFTIEENKGG